MGGPVIADLGTIYIACLLVLGLVVLVVGTAVDLYWAATRGWRLARRWLP